jgi:rfaE bifunctional protein nucleotidyltransferase chain/domain
VGRVVTRQQLVEIRRTLKNEGKRVVFTNGCFDLVHRGHVEYLRRAKALGDVLIVGLNSDASVKRIKGEKRPIVEAEDRAEVLAALDAVDYVCLFDEDTPYELLHSVIPDVLVKGADWNVDDVVGKDLVERAGGVVRTIEYLPHRSTSNIIQTIIERFRS